MMKKRLLSLLLALLMVVTMMPTAVLAYSTTDVKYAVTGGNIYFDKRTGEITDCDESVTEAVIPSKIAGISVTSIGEFAFANCKNLASITIPDSVTSIGRQAFYDCRTLTSVEIPNGVTSIDSGVFAYCTGLTSVEIPDSVTSIGGAAFFNCTSLASVTIPNSVTSIGKSAFFNCYSLTSVTIPDSVTSIGGYAFYSCTSLASINVAAANTAYCSVDGVLFNKNKTELIRYPLGKTESSYVIPNSVTNIGERAFAYCASLKSIIIPSSVTSIGRSAFNSCKNMTSINVEDANTAYSSVNGVLFNKDKTELIQYPVGKTETSYTIPNSVTSIGDYSFQDCDSMKKVVITDGVTSIGRGAFNICTSLTSIIIPNSVTDIGLAAFCSCTSLTSVTIPNSITYINEDTFAACWSLKSVTISDSVTGIGLGAFSDCTDITDVYYSGSEAQWKEIKNFGDNEPLLNAKIHYSSVAPVEPVTPPVSFVDVSSDAFYANAVKWAVENGITEGVGNNRFDPNGQCTRAQVVTFLWRAAGEPSVSARVNFVDVSTSSVYYKAIKWAVANGITKGTDATHFSPDATCTRGQVVTFMHRAANEPYVIGMGGFVDVTYGSYCYNAVQWAVAEGITNGTDIAHFSPNATCTRGQVVTFLYRAQ